MSGPFFAGYDSWKAREPDYDVYGQCDCCGAKVPLDQLDTVFTSAACETTVCHKCRGRDDDSEMDD